MGFPEIFLIAAVIALVMSHRIWNGWGPMDRDRRMGPGRGDARSDSGAERELQGYVEGLETRIAQLEERLDFTERLLMDRPSRPALPEREKSAPDPE